MDIYGFTHSEDDLRSVAEDVLARAKKQGADSASVDVDESFSLDVTVRDGKTDNVCFSHGIGLSVSVYVGDRAGHSSGNSLAPADLDRAVSHALAIARMMGDDDCEGLPDRGDLAALPGPDLDDYGPWRPSVDDMVAMATEMSDAALAVDGRISREKSDGSGVRTGETRGVLANTLGFCHAGTTSRHSVSAGVIADLDGAMETSHWGDSRVHHTDLEGHLDVAAKAARRAVARASPKPAPTAKVPVVYEAGASHSLVRGLLSTLSGDRVYRKLSCHADKVGEMVGAGHLGVMERPFLKRGTRSSVCDDDGVATSDKDIVSEGRLTTHLLGTYSARKLGRRPTGNGGGVTNVKVAYETNTLEGLLKEMGTGLFVTGLMGGGANPVTGDYSAGAQGFWVEGGEIAHPVRDATIAGNLQDMLKGVVG